MNKTKQKITAYDIAAIGLMAAVVFVATNFKIYIPTAIGKTMIHFGNIFCLLSGLLLGGVRGGLAAGIGSAFFDVMDPVFVSSAPFTLVFKFAMGAVCGVIAHSGGSRGEKKAKNIIGALCGSVSYVILYLGKNFVEGYYLHHNPMNTVLASLVQKGSVSLFNGVVAVIVSVLVAPLFLAAMKRAGIYRKLFPSQS